MELIVFLTHNFRPEFVNTLTRLDNDPNITNYKVIVLFDISAEYDDSIDGRFRNIEIVKTQKAITTYDCHGHALYITYFRKNYNAISQYNYIWIIENDVYYPNSFIEFINAHSQYNYDLMVSEYGVRSDNWYWLMALGGFKQHRNIGVVAFIARFSPKMMLTLIDKLDLVYTGYLENLLPHLCVENGLTIHQFLSEMCGILETDNSVPFLELIREDIRNGTRKYIENKIYHPIKL